MNFDPSTVRLAIERDESARGGNLFATCTKCWCAFGHPTEPLLFVPDLVVENNELWTEQVGQLVADAIVMWPCSCLETV